MFKYIINKSGTGIIGGAWNAWDAQGIIEDDYLKETAMGDGKRGEWRSDNRFIVVDHTGHIVLEYTIVEDFTEIYA